MEALIQVFIAYSILGIILSIPFVGIYLKYSAWWHRWRKHQYRIVRTTIMRHYLSEIKIYM